MTAHNFGKMLLRMTIALSFTMSLLLLAVESRQHHHPVAFVTSTRSSRRIQQQQRLFAIKTTKPENHWNEEHLAHGIQEVQEEDDLQLHDSEDAAAWDAHDCNDAGMEAAAEERAVMLAAEMVHKIKEQGGVNNNKKLENSNKWNEEHLAHGVNEVHEETDAELKDSEEAAAWDAHDCNDAGMEAAAEERAVMLAREIVHKLKEEKKIAAAATAAKDNNNSWNEEHLAHGIAEIHEETDAEIKDSEDTAAWDAHDCDDAGMEAAAEERAIMLAAEMAHRMKERAAKKQQKK